MSFIEVEVSEEEFATFSKDRKDAVLFAGILRIDKKISKKIQNHEDRISDLESKKAADTKAAAKGGILGGAASMVIFLFGKLTWNKIGAFWP
jgi:hypothetical protein